MAMMIQKFHKLIQNKIFWWCFATIVSIAMVGLFTQAPSKSDMQQASAVATFKGKPITGPEFQSARFGSYLSLSMALGRILGNFTPEMSEQLDLSAWRRYASLDVATELGLVATDAEVLSTIQQHPGFQYNGQFNRQVYGNFVSQFLGAMGVNEARFEEHVRDEIMLQKMRYMLSTAALVSPHEMKRTFSSISDAFVIEYAKIDVEDLKEEVEVTREEAEAFFEENKEAFLVPERVRVRFVRFPIDSYTEKAAESITEDTAREYYDTNIEDYLKAVEEEAEDEADATEAEVAEEAVDADNEPSTDEVAEATEAPEDSSMAETSEDTASEETASEEIAEADDAALGFDVDELGVDFSDMEIEDPYTPFEDVQDEILETLIREEAVEIASYDATDFSIALTPDRHGNSVTFEDMAEEYNVEVYVTEHFTQDEELPAMDVGLEFNEAAFTLNPNPEEYFSDVIVGDEYIYVLALEERVPESIPTFLDVEDVATEAAREVQLAEVMQEKATGMRDAIEAAIEEGRTFDEAVAPYDVESTKTEEFTAATGIEDSEYSDILLRGILARNQGEITDVLPVEDGILIAHIVIRRAGDPTTYNVLLPQIRDSIRRERAQLLFEEWEEFLLRAGDLQKRDIGDLASNEDAEDVLDDWTDEEETAND